MSEQFKFKELGQVGHSFPNALANNNTYLFYCLSSLRLSVGLTGIFITGLSPSSTRFSYRK